MKLRRLLAVFFALALVAAACGGDEAADTTTTQATTTTAEPVMEPVVIAHLDYLTGPALDQGTRARNGIELAISHINEQGGILNGRQVELEFYDQGYGADVAVASAKKAISDGIVLMTGGGDATSCVPVMFVFAEQDRPVVINSCGTEKALLESDGWAVHLRSPVNSAEADSNALSVVARWMLDQDYERVAAVGVDSDWVINTHAEFTRVFDAEAPASFEYLGMIYFAYGTAEARTEITKAVALNPDMLYLGLWGTDVIVTAIKTARELGYEGDIMMNEYVFTQAEVDALGPELAEGIYGSHEFLPDPAVPANKAFVDAYVAAYGFEPDAMAALAYDSGWIAALAIDSAGCADDTPECQLAIRDAFYTISYTDVNGIDTSFAPWGRRVVGDFYIGQVIDGLLTVVDKATFTIGDQSEPGLGG